MAEFLEFAMFIPLQIITPESSCLEGISLNNYKIIYKIKTKKKYLENLIYLCIKWTAMVEIQHKDFIHVIPIIPCQNSSW